MGRVRADEESSSLIPALKLAGAILGLVGGIITVVTQVMPERREKDVIVSDPAKVQVEVKVQHPAPAPVVLQRVTDEKQRELDNLRAEVLALKNRPLVAAPVQPLATPRVQPTWKPTPKLIPATLIPTKHENTRPHHSVDIAATLANINVQGSYRPLWNLKEAVTITLAGKTLSFDLASQGQRSLTESMRLPAGTHRYTIRATSTARYFPDNSGRGYNLAVSGSNKGQITIDRETRLVYQRGTCSGRSYSVWLQAAK